MIDLLLDIVVWLLTGTGAILVMVGGLGIMRMPDFYSRLHPAGITDTAGAMLILAGMMVEAGPTLIAAKIFMVLIFLMLTSPTSSHALAHAALATGLKPLTIRAPGEPAQPGDDEVVVPEIHDSPGPAPAPTKVEA